MKIKKIIKIIIKKNNSNENKIIIIIKIKRIKRMETFEKQK